MGWALRGEVCTPPSLSQMHILHLNQNRLTKTLVTRWRKKDTEPHQQHGSKGLAVGTMAQRPSSPWAVLAHGAQLWDVRGVGESSAQGTERTPGCREAR